MIDIALQTEHALELARTYHPDDSVILKAAHEYSPEQFIRLFVTAHGMTPVGTWQTHTYAEFEDSRTGKNHFFLIPTPSKKSSKRPNIRMEEDRLWIDDLQTSIYPQSIPHTTPFWYFHYDPNKLDRPFHSMTLNLSPSCPEKCTLCAGAKTGRVNNGMDDTLAPEVVLKKIFAQYPAAASQLDSVAIVTGCFDHFDALTTHLKEVKTAVEKYCSPEIYRVLEHNVTEESRFDLVVRDLGYEVFVTLECFDQESRNIALNGKYGRKGRDSKEFIQILKNYSQYLEAHPELGKKLVRVTYLIGIDSLEVTESFFQQLAEINAGLKNVTVIPWLSIFTPYSAGMRLIQQKGFDLGFIFKAQALAKKYFGSEMMENESGGTVDGYARGLF